MDKRKMSIKELIEGRLEMERLSKLARLENLPKLNKERRALVDSALREFCGEFYGEVFCFQYDVKVEMVGGLISTVVLNFEEQSELKLSPFTIKAHIDINAPFEVTVVGDTWKYQDFTCDDICAIADLIMAAHKSYEAFVNDGIVTPF